jgi:hypothetical protein
MFVRKELIWRGKTIRPQKLPVVSVYFYYGTMAWEKARWNKNGGASSPSPVTGEGRMRVVPISKNIYFHDLPDVGDYSL